ncbi:MAG: hypothetical protein U1A25_02625, partial [Candidatus Sungbacteria bacterium]|nr:hypothetical protein [Candidatus Sungbacteria bacterium]
MKKSLTGLLAAVFLLLSLTSCGDNRSYTAADGLDLHAVASLIYKAHDGEHFEALLNQPGINNLDLDGDGWKDDIDVTERSQGLFRGYSLTVTMPDQSIQEVADIRFEHNMFTGHLTFEILGNTEIYGANRFVRSVQPLTFGQVIFVGWVFAPRPLYVSPYGR